MPSLLCCLTMGILFLQVTIHSTEKRHSSDRQCHSKRESSDWESSGSTAGSCQCLVWGQGKIRNRGEITVCSNTNWVYLLLIGLGVSLTSSASPGLMLLHPMVLSGDLLLLQKLWHLHRFCFWKILFPCDTPCNASLKHVKLIGHYNAALELSPSWCHVMKCFPSDC